jgi:hypothetical protein
VAYLVGAVTETKLLADVNVLFDRRVKKGCVCVHLTHVEIHGCREGREHAQASKANDGGEGVSLVYALALTTTYSNKSRFKTTHGACVIRLNLKDPHCVHDVAARREVDNRPRVVLQGVIMLLHSGLPMLSVGSIYRIGIGLGFGALLGGQKGDLGRRRCHSKRGHGGEAVEWTEVTCVGGSGSQHAVTRARGAMDSFATYSDECGGGRRSRDGRSGGASNAAYSNKRGDGYGVEEVPKQGMCSWKTTWMDMVMQGVLGL